MKDTKRRMELFSLYDRTGIETHLEQMAAEGWFLDHIGSHTWIYRRTEPKQVHFTVTYYPRASDFDPNPSEEQQTFHDFCEHSGWKFVASQAQMQIYYNERENPVPIETEPLMEIESIHKSAKRSFLTPYFILLLISGLMAYSFCGTLLFFPVRILADARHTFTGFSWTLVFLYTALELHGYYSWRRNALAAAEHGEFLKTRSHRALMGFLLCWMPIGIVYWVLSLGTSFEQVLAISSLLYVLCVMFLVNGVKQGLKRRKISAGVNKTATVVSSFVIAFAIMGLLTPVLRQYARDTDYTIAQNSKINFLQNTPLVVADLLGDEYEGYIRKARTGQSILLTQLESTQASRVEDFDEPTLEYTITLVKAPFLYEFCKSSLVRNDYVSFDAAPWSANEAYQKRSDAGPEQQYLILWDDRIVEIFFDWELTADQMAIVSEKLNP